MTHFTDPGEPDFNIRPRRKRRGGSVPPPPSLWDTSNHPPPTPFQIKSPTSIDAASEIRDDTKAKRRDLAYRLIKGSPKGLARFQIASAMGVQDHVISSSVDALVKMRKIEERPSRTIENPASGKQCSVLLWIDSGEMEGAA